MFFFSERPYRKSFKGVAGDIVRFRDRPPPIARADVDKAALIEDGMVQS
jgi:hypothetical protein